MADVITMILVPLGCVFFTVGTVGLLRFGDLRTRLHALTKADTLGLGLIVLGLLPQVPWLAGAKLLLIWILTLGAAALTATLLAGEREAAGEREVAGGRERAPERAPSTDPGEATG